VINRDYWVRKSGLHRIYVLKLEDDHYYVGMTKLTARERFEQHLKGYNSSNWTRRYKPLRIEEVREIGFTNTLQARRQEDMATVEYIERYGISKVRGGSVCFLDEQKANTWFKALQLRYVDGRILVKRTSYPSFPKPIIYLSEYGYNRAKCPVTGCGHDGFVKGFNRHYGMKHAPEQWGKAELRLVEYVEVPA
jgi:predicted GIY-YIG superfamily endonuclease